MEEKMAIILEGLRREKSVSQICREHGISQATTTLKATPTRKGISERTRKKLHGYWTIQVMKS